MNPTDNHRQQSRPVASNRSLGPVTRYPFLQHPTNDNVGHWAASAAPAITGHQAAALIHHTHNHATGITNHLSNHGISPTPRQNLVQSHLAYLRNHWPSGRWHPPNFTPNTDPPPLDVLTPFRSLTEHWERHAGGRPLPDLWIWSDDPANRGLIWQVVDETRATSLTRRVAEAALRRAKELFPAPAPAPVLSRKQPSPAPAAALPKFESKSESKSDPEPEKPRDAWFDAPADDFAPAPLGQGKGKPKPALDDGPLFSPEPDRKPNRTPSPPPMLEDGNESDVSLDGALTDLFAQPGIPLAPKTKKFKKIRETGLALAKKKKDSAEASARRRRSVAEKAAAAVAEAATIGEEGLGADKIAEVAEVLGEAASKAVSRAAKRHYGHLLPPAQRGVITKRTRRRIEDMVAAYL